ncbi:MAG: outer membrane protein assembly factor BamD [Alphaproteobacteria bacterium]|nr:outer membrane protein assembly factor BamD [Alphaproteobacteria bacterium]
MMFDRASARRAAMALLLLVALPGCATLSKINPFGEEEEIFDPTSVTAEELYGRGLDAVQRGTLKAATQQFELVDQTYPYSTWAVNAQLMLGYIAFKQQRYTDGIGALDRFIQLHPAHRDIAYAYYLRSLSFYEQIADIKRDQRGTQEAIGALTEVVNRFPASAYGRDAKLKIDLARDHLAGKELEVGRYYQDQKLYGAAINRFQKVIDDYQTTNHAAEALHRLTEIYLVLGMTADAKRTAAVLGHNYPGSDWYQDSYNTLAKVGEAAPVPANEGLAQPPGLLRRLWQSVF